MQVSCLGQVHRCRTDSRLENCLRALAYMSESQEKAVFNLHGIDCDMLTRGLVSILTRPTIAVFCWPLALTTRTSLPLWSSAKYAVWLLGHTVYACTCMQL